MDSDDEPPSMSPKKGKCVEKLLEWSVFVSIKSYLKDVHVSHLFLSKKDLAKKLSMFTCMKNFQFCVCTLILPICGN